jgi:(p)ppGpp synthase/HD superfamily hydrolase
MDAAVARNIAHAGHTGRRDRFGEPLIEHIERVAAAVPAEARAIAFLHDVLEHSDTTVDELTAAGLTDLERAALLLLTRDPGESYEAHTLRVAHATGAAGRLTRLVKLADLADHLSHREMPHGAPPYAWARMHIANGQARRDRAPGDLAVA